MRVQTSSSRPPATACIRAPNWVGDVIMATPAFRCVRLELSRSRIVLVVRDAVAEVLRGAPWFDAWVICRGGTRSLLRCARQIRGERCELGLVLPNSFSSALMFWLAGVKRRVGYVRDGRGLLLTTPLPRPSADGRFVPTYMADYYLALCEAAGLHPHGRETELFFTERDMQASRAVLIRAGVDLERLLFLFHPAAAYGPSKLWPEERFARLAEMLQEEFGAQVACIGSAAAGGTAQRIAAESRAQVVDLTGCGIGLHGLKCVVRLSRLLVTTDSGPRHYGVALGVPTVCLMGPTDPGYSTSGRPHDHVVRVETDCGPCQRKVCRRDHRCMEGITPEMVLDACRKALRGREGVA